MMGIDRSSYKMQSDATVMAIVLNWRNYKETAETVKVLCELGPSKMDVIVVDNASGNESLEKIRQALKASFAKLVDFSDGSNIDQCPTQKLNGRTLFLVQNKDNLGYAGGNNAGIKAALRIGDPKYMMIVNSDARPKPGAIQNLISAMDSNPKAAFCAGTLIYFGKEDVIQCVGGGRYYSWLGRSRLLGKGMSLTEINKIDIDKLDYLMGACLLFRTEIINDIGLMDEKYFLYGEEFDWQLRARKSGWKLLVCKEAVIEHGDSASTKGSGHSNLFYYYHNRAAILLNAKRFGKYFACASAPFVLIAALCQAKTMKNITWMVRGILDGCRGIGGINVIHK